MAFYVRTSFIKQQLNYYKKDNLRMNEFKINEKESDSGHPFLRLIPDTLQLLGHMKSELEYIWNTCE